jgi:hypothetical protein
LFHCPLSLASFIAIATTLAFWHEGSIFVVHVLWTFLRNSQEPKILELSLS